MNLFDVITILCLVAGGCFYLAGTIGSLRFPDLLFRLHALTKADNLGFGFVKAGLMFHADSFLGILKLAVIWGVALLAGLTSCFTLGRFSRKEIGNSTSLDPTRQEPDAP